MTDALFNPETYQKTRLPLPEASTLPGVCYTSADFFQREKGGIFNQCWHFVGREDELQGVGSYRVFDSVAGSALIIRNAEGALCAYQNVCRHRGSRLLLENGQCLRIVCPYHSWVYSIDGALLNAPGMGEIKNFDLADYSLSGLFLEIWNGFVFIHFGENPTPLLEHLGNFPSTFSSHQPDKMKCVKRFEFDVKSNWKLLTENALEAYHTGTVHRDTLGQQASKPIKTSGNWTGLLVEDESSVGTMTGESKPFPHIEGLNSDAKKGTFFTMVYPCTQFVFSQDCVWWLAMYPLDVARTRIEMGGCFPESTIKLAEFEQKVRPYFQRWQVATEEDNRICERQQQGQSGHHVPGRYALTEFAPHAFNNWLLDQVL